MSDIRAEAVACLIMRKDSCGERLSDDTLVLCDDPRLPLWDRSSFCSCRKLGVEWLEEIDAADPVAVHLIAANERLHAEVQRLTDEHVDMTLELVWLRDMVEQYDASCANIRSENDTLRADLATSEQTIAALKAQLQRVKEAAE